MRTRSFFPSAANLGAYIGLRRRDIRSLQIELAAQGLSSLGRSEGHVLATLDAVISTLQRIVHQTTDTRETARIHRAMGRGTRFLEMNTNRLFGLPHTRRPTRIMVTLPTEAADDPGFVEQLLIRGMDCARINCAHDDKDAWLRMASNVRKAERDTGRSCKILMDLPGPKLRTGPLSPGPAVVRLRPERDEHGNVIEPAKLVLDSSGHPGQDGNRRTSRPPRIAVPDAWLKNLLPDEIVRFRDLRGRPGRVVIEERIGEHQVLTVSRKSAYIEPGIILEHLPLAGQTRSRACAVGAMHPKPLEIRLYNGGLLRLTREPIPGGPAIAAATGETVAPAHVSCVPPEIVDQLEAGHRVWIDDGRIGATVERVDQEGALLKIFRAPLKGARLGPERGLNFPDTRLELSVLSETDLRTLDFVAEHADIVGYSFVQDAKGMDQLVTALEQRNARRLGIIAKIETRSAVQNLQEIIIHGAGRHPFGVMIARGDLALEIGYQRLAEIQEEILWICEAAHVPVVWATQVLESMVKEGIPSRAEITDAAMSERAECVMLNKGPFVLEAIDVLADVLNRMDSHQHKKMAQFRALHW